MQDVRCRDVDGIKAASLALQHGLKGLVFGGLRATGGKADVGHAGTRLRTGLGDRRDLHVGNRGPASRVIGRFQSRSYDSESQRQAP